MPKYIFYDGPVPIKNAKTADPQALGEAMAKATAALEQKRASGEKIEQDDAVINAIHDEAVRLKDKSPYYNHLEWDNEKAGRLYRLDQIRGIIRMIRVVDETTGDQHRAFIHVKAAGERRGSFRTVETVSSNLDLQIAALRSAERDLLAFRNRYREFEDLCADAAVMAERARMKREMLMQEAASPMAA